VTQQGTKIYREKNVSSLYYWEMSLPAQTFPITSALRGLLYTRLNASPYTEDLFSNQILDFELD
jgi:hypothetical protein